ncbi:hypothetical protein CS022_07225 [Veronia nyctiphanis]|uniref:Probable membrane transporter protein n=1 Tax=Veronia nyctiphanis TaxID=1278244 RepID=A0A4Q0YRI5_9GAMM|nr:sulfite exporter TauE/SafE family protein [Veronia nyctiphanis]RXJ73790.1 hypothetical protein CS022_07225 [Veronia nyctiphanis]
MLDATLWIFLTCLALGSVVGLLAGLLGIGGGLLVVPALTFLFPLVDIVPDQVMPMALATSLASIVLTASSSARSHYKMGNVDIRVIRTLLPGILIGGLLGSALADMMPTEILPKVFGGIVLLLAIQMLISMRFKSSAALPDKFGNLIGGTGIGVTSSLAGIGGGSLIVPYLSYFGVEMRRAIGSASLCGVFLAISGMTGFIFFGFHHHEPLPPYSIGYVYLPALLGIVSTSVLTTGYGARLATQLPVDAIKKVFALFLICVAFTMLI